MVAGLLAAVYAAAGLMKFSQPREKLIANNMGWVEDFFPPMVMAIGTLELLGAIGLILPDVLDFAPVLTPLAATGLMLLQIGATATHLRRREPQVLPVNVLPLAGAAFAAFSRFAG